MGLEPTTHDGFETGDFRNFAPIYLGTESDWIRSTARVSDDRPITGEHSLRWTADEQPHRWALISNAFPLSPPLEIAVSLRVDGPAEEPYAAGVGIAASESRAAVARATENGFELTTDTWDSEPAATTDIALERGETYELSIALDGTDLTAVVCDTDGTDLTSLTAETTIEPNALALYVDTVADGETAMTFDDVTVDGGPYRVRSGEWSRSSPFVVLPRAPDVDEDQGNWVGAPTVVDEGDRLRMWYRIRNDDQRGVGYGLAESTDGLTWEKSRENPVLVPHHDQNSNEGITVLRVDDAYRAWYTIDADDTWKVVHATSTDGLEWEDHGVVIEGYCKDPVALYVDGTYYLYAIAPTNTQFSVYTSPDGHTWTRENTIDLGSHGHPGACYVEETETVWLYAFAEEGSASPVSRVRRAASTDGIHFGDLEPTWHDPPVGLDYRPSGGVDYGAFPGDGHGHLPNDRRTLMYYQTRHDYRNNRPSWHHAGDGLVVLAGRFTGLFEGVPTTVDRRGYTYHAFPINEPVVDGLDVAADDPVTLTVQRWTPTADVVARGTVEPSIETTVTVSVSGLDPDAAYALRIDGEEWSVKTDEEGRGVVEVTTLADGTDTFELVEP
ncbi:hypothetical protein [Halomontanus rarus]|uniref:hypothetical protein n=1 Tax=Halomontanus rarus TaxID=3034020 RepID=UPI0023E8A43E|nr:hypothetical protein [Halovivax sp. TS33]